MKRISNSCSRLANLLVAMALVSAASLVLALAAGAATGTFADASGDAPGGAPDITSVTVSSAAGDTEYDFQVPLPGATYGSSFFLDIYLHTDADNANYLIRLYGGQNRIEINRWNGSDFVPFTAGLLLGSQTLQPETIRLGRADIGGASSFEFSVRAWNFVSGSSPECCYDETPQWSFALDSAGATSSASGGAAGTTPTATSSASGGAATTTSATSSASSGAGALPVGGTSATAGTGAASTTGTTAATAGTGSASSTTTATATKSTSAPSAPPFSLGSLPAGLGTATAATGSQAATGSAASTKASSIAAPAGPVAGASAARTSTVRTSTPHTSATVAKSRPAAAPLRLEAAASARAGRGYPVGIDSSRSSVVSCQATIGTRLLTTHLQVAGSGAICLVGIPAGPAAGALHVRVQVLAAGRIVQARLVRRIG